MLNTVAKIVLADRFDLFVQLHEQFLTDRASVNEREGFAEHLDENSSSDDLLWVVAYTERRVDWIDWTGEYEPGQLKTFIDERMKLLAGVQIDWGFFDIFEKDTDFSKLKRGDYILKQFACIDSRIRQEKFLIATLNRGDDQYYPFVASIEDFRKIDGAEIGQTIVTACVDL